MLFKVIKWILWVRFDSVRVRLGIPIGRADLAVLLIKLKRLNQTQRLVHWTSDWQVIHCYLSKYTIRVNDEQASERQAIFLHQHVVVVWNVLIEIAQQRILQATETTLLAVQVNPGQVAKVTVGGHAHYFGVDFTKLVDFIAKRNDFSGTDKGAWEKIDLTIFSSKQLAKLNNKWYEIFLNLQIQWIKKQNQILSLVIGKLNLLEVAIDHGRAVKVRSWKLNASCIQLFA